MGIEMFKSFAKGYDKKINDNRDAVIYTRVSSKDQEQNRSLTTQLGDAEKYASVRRFTVTETFGGTYESASKDFTRKEFSKLISVIRNAKKKPYAVLINTISRFSRSGAGGITLASELNDELGVHLIEVSTGLTTETVEGKNEIYRKLLRAKEENDERLKITLPGMKKHLEEGNWLGRVPRGYDQYGPRVKNEKFHSSTPRICINVDGRVLQQAWQWKLQGERDFVIENRLRDLGLKKITAEVLSKMWRNPFYCGICSHKMLDGKVVSGNWEKMVSQEDFLYVQEILAGNRQGYKQDKSNPDRPLNAFIHCNDCGGKMSGYEVKKKRVHYYKCQMCKGISINADTTKRAKGDGAHEIFIELLNDYALPGCLEAPFKEQLKLTFQTLNTDNEKEGQQLKKELEKHENDLKSLNRRYGTDKDFDKEIYLELKQEFETKITDLTRKVAETQSKISNLDKYVTASNEVAQNLSKYWTSDSLETKRRIQELVFPDGLVLDVKNRVYLTKNVNTIFELSSDLARVPEGINEKRQPINGLPFPLVAGDGFEPTTFGL